MYFWLVASSTTRFLGFMKNDFIFLFQEKILELGTHRRNIYRRDRVGGTLET